MRKGCLFCRILFSTSLLVALNLGIGCGGGSSDQPSGTGKIPQVAHVFVLVEENHSYSSVIGNAAMPYTNSLAQKYALATAYYANTHNSLPNYFMLTVGQLIANNDLYSGTVTADNVVRALTAAGKSWRIYAESLPNAGYMGVLFILTAKTITQLSTYSMYIIAPRQRRILFRSTSLLPIFGMTRYPTTP